MAGEMVQRGLNLQVQAEDLASATLLEIGDQLDSLQARAQSVFGAIGMAAEDAASSLSDAANLFAPEWESQLEALQQSADAVFTALADSGDAAAASMSASASNVAEAWMSSIDDLKGSTGTAQGALDTLQGDMEATAGVADQTAAEIGGAYSADSLALDASKGSLGALDDQFVATAGTATSNAAKVSAAWDGQALGLDAGVSTLKGVQAQFVTTGDDAEAASKKIAKSFSSTTLALDDAKPALGALQDQMDATAETAKADAKVITDSFAGASAGIADASAAAAAAGAGAGAGADAAAAAGAGSGEVAGINFGKDKTGKGKGFKLPSPSLSGLMTGGITAALGLGAVNLGISQLEGLEALKATTGMGWTQTLTTAAAARGVGMTSDDITRLIQRLDTHIGKLDQATVKGANVQGKVVGFGMGRLGVDPNTLAAGITAGSGSGNSAGLALKALGLTPDQMTGLNAQQQLATIATKLESIKNATLRTAVINELFGKGTDTANLLQKFTLATTEAQKNLPKGLAKDLALTLGNPKSMVDMQEQMFYLEVEMSASLMKMVPILSKVLGEASKHTSLLMEIALGAGAAGVVNKITKPAGGIEGILEKLLGKGAGKLVGKVAGSEAGKLGAGAAALKYGPKVLGKAGKLGLDISPEVIGAEIAAAISGSSGTDLSNTTANDTSAFAKAWQKLVAPHTGGVDAHGHPTGPPKFTQADSVKAIAQAAKVFGLNPAAMLADSYAEATLNPYALGKPVKGQGQAHGILQFMPKTWASDTKKLFGGGGLPIADAMNPYIAAFVGADAMKKGGIGSEKDNQAALLDMIKNFENPGAAGAAGDMARGIPFLAALKNQLAKATQVAKAQTKKGSGKASSPGRHMMMLDDSAGMGTMAPDMFGGMSLLPATGGDTGPVAGTAGSSAPASDPLAPLELNMGSTIEKMKLHTQDLSTNVETTMRQVSMSAMTHGKEFALHFDDSMAQSEKFVLAHREPLKKAGIDTMDGLLEGLKQEKAPLLAEATSIANEIEATIRSALKTKSPSEVTAEIGADLMAGLAVGMQRATPETVSAARGASLDVAGALATSAPGGGGGPGGDVTVIVMLDSAEIGRTVGRQLHGTMKVIAKLP